MSGGAPSEFGLIARYFTRPARTARLGVGDDAALLAPTPGSELALSTDMLVAGRHFLPDADPQSLGHKTLAVNLSDLAAMGATPRWALLALALPEADAAWLQAFSNGLYALADQHGVELIGGDTTRGPLNLCVTILGEAPTGQALTRAGARPGDEIWVSGSLGGAALGLQHLLGMLRLDGDEQTDCLLRLHRPTPRVALGQALLGKANAAIDISDGLLADLGHILGQSAVGAELHFADLPAHPAIRARLPDALAQRCLLAGGDDYELCFTAPPQQAEAIQGAAAAAGVPVTRIGHITVEPGLTLLDAAGQAIPIRETGFDHFPS